MITTIPSNNARFKIMLRVVAKRPFTLGIRVYDPRYGYSHYFRRKACFNSADSARTFIIMLPVSPEVLELELYDKASTSDDAFEVLDVKVEQMPAVALWATDAQHRFLEFAIAFAQKAGYTAPGFYESSDHEFLFQYLRKITDPLGKELITPTYTVPIRVAILAHEGCHWFLNTRSQTTADLCGIKQYLDYGFPTIEAIYAVTKVFGTHPEVVGAAHIERVRDVVHFIENYKANG